MRGKTCVVVGLGTFLAAGWSAAQDTPDDAWDLGVSAGDSAGDATEDGERDPARETPRPAIPALDLPPDARLVDVLEELRERCGPPSLAEALEAAVAVAGLEPGAEEDLVDQARWAAALPRVRLSVRRSWEYDESLDLEPDPADGKYGVDTDDDLEVGVTAQWDLGSIVAPPEAVTARRLELEAARARQALRAEVTRAYFERCLLRLEWVAGSEDAGRRAELVWRIAEAEARLDALTGGLLREETSGAEPEDRNATWSSAAPDGTM